MPEAYSFSELLQRDGAEPPRCGRGKWRCAHCEGKSWTLSVHPQKEVAHCFRCGWSCGRRALESSLGIATPKQTRAEVHQRQMIRREAEGFAEWLRVRKVEQAALLRDLGRHDLRWREVGREQLASGQSVSEPVFEELHQLIAWLERAEVRYRVLCNLELHGSELYQEFLRRKQEAA